MQQTAEARSPSVKKLREHIASIISDKHQPIITKSGMLICWQLDCLIVDVTSTPSAYHHGLLLPFFFFVSFFRFCFFFERLHHTLTPTFLPSFYNFTLYSRRLCPYPFIFSFFFFFFIFVTSPCPHIMSSLLSLGAILAAGILDAGGRNVVVSMHSRQGFMKMGWVKYLFLFILYFFCFDFEEFILLFSSLQDFSFTFDIICALVIFIYFVCLTCLHQL